MHILVTNDDGITAPGLLALVQAMRPLGKVSILAPDHNWSGGGHVKTIDRPLRVSKLTLADGSIAFASDGAPSDCVALALLGFIPEKIDLVVSGINPMANLGHDVTYSGTVTAAMEAIIWGVPGIAFSLDSGEKNPEAIDFQPAARIASQIAAQALNHSLPMGVFLNVNVPGQDRQSIEGIRLTRQGLRVYRDRLDVRQDPRSRPYYWIGGEVPTGVPEVRSLSQLTLTLEQPNRFRPIYQLRAGAEILGKMHLEGSLISVARIESGDGAWEFTCTRFIMLRIGIRRADMVFVGSYEGRRDGSDILEFLDGRIWSFH
jgi:5'-nucleotidase